MEKKRLALITTVVAASAVLELLPLKLFFPLLPYLTFDIGEVPIFFLTLYDGITDGAIASIALTVLLFFFGTFVPIGPLLKGAAVISAIIGAWAGIKIKRSPYLSFILSTLLRIIAMTAFNYVLIEYFVPGFLTFLPKYVSFMSPMVAVLVLTALFNILQNIISFIPAYAAWMRFRTS
ncbi:MAG: hypothetical protein M1291_04365 [Thaumarchaeota archaeon]|nr:hypothetical protein [Nitrososphaerota archaeon]